MGLIIPQGWYQLGLEEIVRKGDRFCLLDETGSQDLGWWDLACSTIKHKASTQFLHFIRKGESEEKPKEWINPWDD